MVEDRRLGDAIAYVILTIGVLIVAFGRALRLSATKSV